MPARAILKISDAAYEDIRKRIEDLAKRVDPSYKWQYMTAEGRLDLSYIALEPESPDKLKPRD